MLDAIKEIGKLADSDPQAAARNLRAMRLELRKLANLRRALDEYPEDWAQWLLAMLPAYFSDRDGRVNFADHHREFWDWVRALEPGKPTDALIEIIFREGGKSTDAEAAILWCACERVRNYGLYVCGTQDQANDHLSNINDMMMTPEVRQRYPGLRPMLSEVTGMTVSWRVNRLRTAGGFVIDAIGLDKAVRGAKLKNFRPDIIVLDDVDALHDTPERSIKKERTISQSILPTGSDDLAVIAVQNLLLRHGVFGRMQSGDSDILQNRRTVGPVPALRDFRFQEDKTTGRVQVSGVPTWSAFDVKRCQATVDRIGFRSFRVEYQHEVEFGEGMFLADIFVESVHCVEPFQVPPTWYVDRSYDYGTTRPWCCQWWAESDGSEVTIGGIRYLFPAGTLFMLQEAYGYGGKPDVGDESTCEDQARRIQKIETEGPPWLRRTMPGPADPSIFSKAGEVFSMADRMQTAAGILWDQFEHGPPSRVQSGDAVKARLMESQKEYMEGPGLFVVKRNCPHTVRTWKKLPRHPLIDGDTDPKAEDHAWDPTRYRVVHVKQAAQRVPYTLG